MVGANQGVEVAGQTDTWPLSLSDGIDDKDGAGLVNYTFSGWVLHPDSQKDGAETASVLGHDYGFMASSQTPADTWYSETWNAVVDPGQTLRVAAHMQAKPTCSSGPAHDQQCNSEAPYPRFILYVFYGFNWVASANYAQNYQFVSLYNNSAQTWNVAIAMYIDDWSGISQTGWGLAWAQGGQG